MDRQNNLDRYFTDCPKCQGKGCNKCFNGKIMTKEGEMVLDFTERRVAQLREDHVKEVCGEVVYVSPDAREMFANYEDIDEYYYLEQHALGTIHRDTKEFIEAYKEKYPIGNRKFSLFRWPSGTYLILITAEDQSHTIIMMDYEWSEFINGEWDHNF